jgi:hypothetical protein
MIIAFWRILIGLIGGMLRNRGEAFMMRSTKAEAGIACERHHHFLTHYIPLIEKHVVKVSRCRSQAIPSLAKEELLNDSKTNSISFSLE